MESLHNRTTEPQPDLARLLPREVFGEIILMLRACLPPARTERAGDEVRRDRAALAAVAALLPETAAEGRLAAQFVAADAWAMDCLREAQEEWRQPMTAGKCKAQALSLMREGKSALRLLLRLQAERRERVKQEAAAGRAEWVEHCAVGMMADALAGEAGAGGAMAAAGVTGSASPTHPVAARKFGQISNSAKSFTGTLRETGARPRMSKFREAPSKASFQHG